MRLFQFDTFYSKYLEAFYSQHGDAEDLGFEGLNLAILNDRFAATHILEPVYSGDAGARFVVSNDTRSQRLWAREHGFKARDLKEILLAQIEDHRADVVYNQNPLYTGSSFMKLLPGCVKKRVCWHAAPVRDQDFSSFDLCLSNYVPFLENWSARGIRAAYFNPSHDPVMSEYSANEDRPVDICFVGSYTRGHLRRNSLLIEVASLSGEFRIVLALMHPRFRPWIDRRFIHRIPSPFHYLPRKLHKVASAPVFGRELYNLFSRSKIVLNASIDMAGEYRGNMRCFEAMGIGACMLSDRGVYPDGFVDGQNMVLYDGFKEAVAKAKELLRNQTGVRTIGQKAAATIATRYSKIDQWRLFENFIA